MTNVPANAASGNISDPQALLSGFCTVGKKAETVRILCPSMAQWMRDGMYVIAAPDVSRAIEVPASRTQGAITALGCGGWDSAGALFHVGFDLDVGHGRPEQQYERSEDAIDAARTIRQLVNGAAEIRRSKGGSGIHVRVAITPGAVTRDGRKTAANIAKWLVAKLGIRCDRSVLGRQCLWVWAEKVGSRGFELEDLCIGTWAPPAEALVEPRPVPPPPPPPTEKRDPIVERARKYLAKMPVAVAGHGGHNTAYHVVCTVVQGFDLKSEQAWPLLLEWNQRCQPPWSEHELRHKLEEALKGPGERGYLVNGAGSRTGRAEICAADLAQQFLIKENLRDDRELRMRFYRQEFYVYVGSRYQVVPDSDLQARILKFLQDDPNTRHSAGPNLASSIVANLAAMTLVPADVNMPAWLALPIRPVPRLISMANGIVDLDKALAGQPPLYKHSPELFTTISLPYAYDPAAKCPGWTSFMLAMFPPDVIALIQEWMGYNLIHDTRQEKFVILCGEGANGKTVVLTVFRELLGDGNYSSLALEAFNPVRTFPLAATVGMLANIVGEIGEWDKTAEGVVKHYVTGEPMTIERKHRDAFEFTPTARLTFATNTLPRFTDRSDGLWRRLLLIHCTAQILEESKQDKRLVDPQYWRATGELPGVFNWAVEGLRRLLARGHFVEPQVCKEAKSVFKRDSNQSRVFLEENCRQNPQGSAVSRELYRAYHEWAEANGQKPLAAQHFATEVRRAFPSAVLSPNALNVGSGQRSRVWSGIVKI